MTHDVHIRSYRAEDEESVVELWNLCNLVVPWNDPHKDIRRKIAAQPDLLLVGEAADAGLVATVMVGYDGHRGWINYLAVHPEHRGSGIGHLMMEEAERRLSLKGCPKINLQVRSSNTRVIRFYETLGFKVDDVVNLGKRLERDD